jgi:hypothetical protein
VTRLKERKEIVHPKTHVLDLVATKRSSSQHPLLFLQSQNPVFNRPINLELVDIHVARLAVAMSTVKGLFLKGGVPPEVDEDDIVASREVETCGNVSVREHKRKGEGTCLCSQP